MTKATMIAHEWERRVAAFPNRTMSSGDGSSFPSSGELGRNSSMPSLKGLRPSARHHHQQQQHYSMVSPNPYIFDAARFANDKKAPSRYMDRDRERHVARWLMEARDALEAPKHKRRPPPPMLRRFHSHDANSGFEDQWADGELKRARQRQECDRSRNGSCDRSESSRTPFDGGSTASSSRRRRIQYLSPRQFVEKHTLPAVVETSSDVLLLYRHMSNYTRVEAVRLVGKKNKPVGRPIYIPEGYQGWFAVVTGNGSTSAKAFSTVAELVRARVPCFLPAAPLPAYLLQRDTDGDKWSYVKGSARGGTPLRLAGVFEEAPKNRGSKSSIANSQTSATAAPQRYAQLVDPNMTELYVPLSTKGEFYPIGLEPSEDRDNQDEGLHRLSSLLRRSLPLRVRLVAGPALPPPLHPTLAAGTLLLRAVTTEAVLLTCSLPDSTRPPCLALMSLNSDTKLQRANLGFDSEKKLLFSPRVQKALHFCQAHADSWIRQISFALPENNITNDQSDNTKNKSTLELDQTTPDQSSDKKRGVVKYEKEKKFTFQGLKADASRLFGKSDKILKDIPDENEGSIIFISKNELEHMQYDEEENEKINAAQQQQFVDEKMKVFRESSHPKLTKWFKHLKMLRSTERLVETDKDIAKLEKYKEFRDPFDPTCDKRSSMERYQDMSKLIEDRFGGSRLMTKTDEDKKQSYRSLTTTTSSSDIGVSSEPKRILTKSVSVQTGMFGDEKRNASIEQINYYSENDSSLRRERICDEPKKVGRFERRQRIRPDLIPERSDIASSESFDQIQSCEDLNALETNQQSFITEKLCSEFHVKTKRVLSKSTSNLIHAKEKKVNGNNTIVDEPTKPKRSVSSIQNRKLPVIEDLPYGQVADAISESYEHERRDSEISDNIYAEICGPELTKETAAEQSVFEEKICNDFRHIEVVVIERRTVDNVIDSDCEDAGSSGGAFSAGNSLEKETKVTRHAIRLEVTHDESDDKIETPKDGSYVKFCQGMAVTNDTEGIYNTLK